MDDISKNERKMGNPKIRQMLENQCVDIVNLILDKNYDIDDVEHLDIDQMDTITEVDKDHLRILQKTLKNFTLRDAKEEQEPLKLADNLENILQQVKERSHAENIELEKQNDIIDRINTIMKYIKEGDKLKDADTRNVIKEDIKDVINLILDTNYNLEEASVLKPEELTFNNDEYENQYNIINDILQKLINMDKREQSKPGDLADDLNVILMNLEGSDIHIFNIYLIFKFFRLLMLFLYRF